MQSNSTNAKEAIQVWVLWSFELLAENLSQQNHTYLHHTGQLWQWLGLGRTLTGLKFSWIELRESPAAVLTEYRKPSGKNPPPPPLHRINSSLLLLRLLGSAFLGLWSRLIDDALPLGLPFLVWVLLSVTGNEALRTKVNLYMPRGKICLTFLFPTQISFLFFILLGPAFLWLRSRLINTARPIQLHLNRLPVPVKACAVGSESKLGILSAPTDVQWLVGILKVTLHATSHYLNNCA